MADSDVTTDTTDTPRRARRRTGENRERLILAGILCFGRTGFSGTSTGEIAATADVPQPHVYANFSTKHALFLECLSLVIDILISEDTSIAEAQVPSAAENSALVWQPPQQIAERRRGLLRHVMHAAPQLAYASEDLAQFVFQAIAAGPTLSQLHAAGAGDDAQALIHMLTQRLDRESLTNLLSEAAEALTARSATVRVSDLSSSPRSSA